MANIETPGREKASTETQALPAENSLVQPGTPSPSKQRPLCQHRRAIAYLEGSDDEDGDSRPQPVHLNLEEVDFSESKLRASMSDRAQQKLAKRMAMTFPSYSTANIDRDIQEEIPHIATPTPAQRSISPTKTASPRKRKAIELRRPQTENAPWSISQEEWDKKLADPDKFRKQLMRHHHVGQIMEGDGYRLDIPCEGCDATGVECWAYLLIDGSVNGACGSCRWHQRRCSHNDNNFSLAQPRDSVSNSTGTGGFWVTQEEFKRLQEQHHAMQLRVTQLEKENRLLENRLRNVEEMLPHR